MLHAARILHAIFAYFKVIFPSLVGPYVKRNGVFLEIVHKPGSEFYALITLSLFSYCNLTSFCCFFRIYADDFLLIFKKFTYGAAIILGLGQYSF